MGTSSARISIKVVKHYSLYKSIKTRSMRDLEVREHFPDAERNTHRRNLNVFDLDHLCNSQWHTARQNCDLIQKHRNIVVLHPIRVTYVDF